MIVQQLNQILALSCLWSFRCSPSQDEFPALQRNTRTLRKSEPSFPFQIRLLSNQHPDSTLPIHRPSFLGLGQLLLLFLLGSGSYTTVSWSLRLVKPSSSHPSPVLCGESRSLPPRSCQGALFLRVLQHLAVGTQHWLPGRSCPLAGEYMEMKYCITFRFGSSEYSSVAGRVCPQ